MNINFIRNCPNPKHNPSCNITIKYTNEVSYKTANRRNTVCKQCSGYRGKTKNILIRICPNPNHNPNCKGEIVYKSKYGTKYGEIKNSKCNSCQVYGTKRPKSNKSILNHRKSITKSWNDKYNNYPNYNPNSISIIEQKAKELGITDLQHAENGGEFYIEELGYWIDGYSKDKNIVIEYYEKSHKYNIVRDTKREKEIRDLLNCEFIIIKEC
jgi:hypothetical protein